MHNLKQVSGSLFTFPELKDVKHVYFDPLGETMVAINGDRQIVQISKECDSAQVLTFLPDDLGEIVGCGMNSNQYSYWLATDNGQIWHVKLDEPDPEVTLQMTLQVKAVESAIGSSESDWIVIIPRQTSPISSKSTFLVLDSYYELQFENLLEPSSSDVTKAPVICNLKFDNHFQKKVKAKY